MPTVQTPHERFPTARWFDPPTLVSMIRPGDSVTILVPNGIGRNGQEWKEKTGKAVICSGTHAALNMGGQYGTPGVATPENIVAIGKVKRALHTSTTGTPWRE